MPVEPGKFTFVPPKLSADGVRRIEENHLPRDVRRRDRRAGRCGMNAITDASLPLQIAMVGTEHAYVVAGS
jgi:hypothetical protein